MVGLSYAVPKRAMDVVVAAIVLAVTSPVWASVALVVRLHDGGPVLYRGSRAGRGGRPFAMLKFRTMVVDAELVGGSSTASDDIRITPAGRWLRKTKLDELPQFVNVLRGDMSLVGPRPQVLWEVDRYSERERAILAARPGITDWASIEFRNEGEILAGQGDPDDAYERLIRPRKMELGLQYVEQMSLRTDFLILVATARAVVTRR